MANKYSRVASFSVDPQNGFTPLCPNELPVGEGDKIVPFLLEQDALASLTLVSYDWHPEGALWEATENHPQLSPVGAENVDVHWKRHCVANTFGSQLLSGLPSWLQYDFAIAKGYTKYAHPYGACYHDLANTRSTGAIEFLKANGIDSVIVGGLATDYCVKETTLQLAKAGFRVVLNLQACREIAEDSLIEAVAQMNVAGVRFADIVSDIPANLS